MDKVTVTGDVKDFPLETIIKLDANRIAAEMVHKANDNTVWDEVSFPGIKEKLHKLVDDYKKKQDEETIRRCEMDNVEKYIDALSRLPQDNGRDLVWCYCVMYSDGSEGIGITMQNRWAKPPVTYQRFIPFYDIYAMDDPESAAAKMIELMYDEAGEHSNTEKLLMSPDEAAGILREFAKDYEEVGCWDIDDEDLVTALNVAIKCLEVTL